MRQLNKKQIGITLTELRGDESRLLVAEAIGISNSALQMYENGKRVPRDEIKVKIANYYNRSVQEIFFENEQHEMCC